ncbi:C4-dicarboxylate ABC transporter [Oceanispirochaeta crateris]|uniref:C4-dicarboxylate ABC transporter n=1 Tax=Oceanispirochaeta crateris TaxID=2518645 RepID=A0A5C1QSF9_9SPIO|nr:C4-dicarboxylate TRAP transporter substrate-binding protein [Oceanispirochaeta crateris]QEN09584.1 C4-dicarboxylate ABC transporter [Oceanispirochaeta crateris]
MKKNLLIVLSLLLAGNLFAGGQQESGEMENAKPKSIKVYIAGTSGADDTQSMGHFEYAKRLNAESDGVFAAEVKISGVMGETDDVTEQAIQGVPVINATDPGRLAAFVPEFGLIQMPYLLPDYTYLNKIKDTKLYAKWDKQFQDMGLKLVTVNGYSGVRSWVTDFPVRTPADLKGVKIRTIGSDLFVNSVNAMGAIATALPWGETYQGMEQGVVDGTEAQIPGIYSMRFYEIKKYVSLSEHFTLIASMVTGTKFFNSIPAEYQTILLDQAYASYKDNQEIVVSKSAEYIKEMEASGVTFVEIDKTPFIEAVQPVYDDMGFSDLKKELYAELGL